MQKLLWYPSYCNILLKLILDIKYQKFQTSNFFFEWKRQIILLFIENLLSYYRLKISYLTPKKKN